MEFFSTPFDLDSVKILNELGVKLFKIASADINNIPLINAIRKTKKPTIISTGYSTFSEISDVYTLLKESSPELAILHCVAKYPAEIEHMNLENISLFKRVFDDAKIGISDHSKDTKIVPAVSYGLGARIFEKHFTLDNSLPGYDHAMSLNPAEFKEMCKTIQEAALAMGCNRIATGRLEVERERVNGARRSIYYQKDIKIGTKLTEKHIVALRPGDGVSVARWNEVLGKKITKTKNIGERLDWDDFK